MPNNYQAPLSIFAKIRQEVKDYTESFITVVEGYQFNQYQTIKKNHLYYNSQFVSGPIDSAGRKKIFFNIVKPPCKVAARYLNFDTKDIRLIANNPNSEMATFLLEKELKQWMKTNKVANIMNKIANDTPPQGTTILMKTKGGAKPLDLRYISMDQTVDRVTDSPFFNLELQLTPSKMREKAADGWDKDKIEEAISKFYTNQAPSPYMDQQSISKPVSTPYVKCYQAFGEVPESWLTDSPHNLPGQKLVRSLFIVAGVDNPIMGTNENNAPIVMGEEGVILFKSKWFGDWPLRDFHYDKTPGRYLGIGIIEDLYPIQERVNELVQQKRSSMAISSMHIFQSQDRTVVKNILNDLVDGAVLMAGAKGGITAIGMEERNLPAFQSEEERYAKQTNDMTFAYDATRGEALPSTTPATNAVIQERNSSSVYLFKREDLGNMYRDFFNDEVIPQAIRSLDKEHIIHFIGGPEELAKIDSVLVNNIAKSRGIEMMLAGQFVDVPALKEKISQELKKGGSSRFIEYVKGFYKKASLDFDINTQNEQENVPIVTANLFTLVTTLAKSPGALQDPILKALIYEWAEKSGISAMKLESAANLKDQNAQMAQSTNAASAAPDMASMIAAAQNAPAQQ